MAHNCQGNKANDSIVKSKIIGITELVISSSP